MEYSYCVLIYVLVYGVLILYVDVGAGAILIYPVTFFRYFDVRKFLRSEGLQFVEYVTLNR
jgi:hypothetical protein